METKLIVGRRYLIRRFLSGITELRCMEETHTSYKIMFENGNTFWEDKDNVAYWCIIEDLGETKFFMDYTDIQQLFEKTGHKQPEDKHDRNLKLFDYDDMIGFGIMILDSIKSECKYNKHIVSQRSELLIDFLIELNDKGLINNHDFDYEKEAKKYAKKRKY